MSAKTMSRISSFLSSFLPQTWLLKRNLSHLNRIFRKEITDAERKGSNKDPQEVLSRWDFEASWIEEELQDIFDTRLIRKAKRLHISIPNKVEGIWEQGQTGKMLFTPAAREDLRKAVREVRKDRREAAMFWISAIFGLIGILTGLIAVWRR